MYKSFFADSTPFVRLMMTLFITTTSFLIILVVALPLGMFIFDMKFSEIGSLAQPNTPTEIHLAKFIQIAQSLGLFIIPALLIGLLFFSRQGDPTGLGFTFSASYTSVLLAGVIMVAALPFINMVAEITSWLRLPEFLHSTQQWIVMKESEAQRLTQIFLHCDSVQDLLFNLILIAVIPAFGEEMLFRGIFQRIFADWTRNRHWGILISAFLFSAMHIQFLGFVPRFLLGLLFGYLFEWSKSLWLPILAHFTNNAMAVIAAFYMGSKQSISKVETIGTDPETFYWGFISLMVAASIAYYIYRIERIRQIQVLQSKVVEPQIEPNLPNLHGE